MTNPIAILSRERLEQLADDNTICKVSWDERIEMARALLAVMDAKPTCWEIAGQIFSTEEEALEPGYIGRPEPLYETPPLPSAPDGWIKCSDRMPEPFVEVICTTDIGCMWIAAVNNRGTWDDGDFLDDISGITCWMPLPAAPEQ